jgi:endonuclease/exonuclease/phosphatase family metal-dependent hydrolase
MRTTIDHRSGRFDRPTKLLAADLLELSQTCSIVALTEQGNLSPKRQAALRLPKWSWFHADERGADDCAVLWDGTHWLLDGWARAVPLTSVVWRRVAKYGGRATPPVHATVAPLRSRVGGVRVVVIVVHMPTRSTVLRRRAWASCVNGLVKLVRQVRKTDPHARIALAADWNADWLNPRDRALMTRAAKRMGLTPLWGEVEENRGTHGPRLIDAIWTDAEIHDGRVLDQTEASDHRPVRAVLNITRRNTRA